MSFINRMVDERFLTHRLRSSSLAGMAGAALAGGLFLYRLYVDHVTNWDLFAIVAAIAIIKLVLMGYYLLTD